MTSPSPNEPKIESVEVPKEIYELISYVAEMKRNHIIMAARIDNIERNIETLKRMIRK